MIALDDLSQRTWTLSSIGDEPAAEGVTSTLELGADGRLRGHTGVNRLMGAFVLDGDTIELTGVATTRMAGPPPAMAQERALLRALEGPQPIELDGDVLTIGAARFESEAASPSSR